MKFLFYKPIKASGDENNVIFWSDTHFGHRCEQWDLPLWKTRGFNSIEEHDEIIIKRWNAIANQHSTFFHLGDFMFGRDTVQRFKDIVHRLNFETLYLMPGNHCSGWKQNFEEHVRNVWDVSCNKRVVFIPNYVETYVNEQPIVMCHYPLASFNGQGKGSWMLHGHCHGNLYKSEIGPILYKTKIVEIGIEKFPNPLTFGDLKNFFKDRENLTFDHHNNNTKNPF